MLSAKKHPIKEALPGSFDHTSSTYRLPFMLPVAGGTFLMGTSDDDIKHLQLRESDWAYDWTDNELFANEQPQHKVVLTSFEIGQFPVTNIEYHLFIKDSGYRLPKGWIGFRYPDGMEFHPVVSVSKIDAENYIKWLNDRTGMNYRLATEAEWERSARGDDGRIYPWGNTFDPWRCNTAESMKKGTTPMGSYSPGGDSYLGVADMVGNVWEWTSSQFKPYPYISSDGREEKRARGTYVIRGGSWYYTRKLARCAAREGMVEDHVSPIIGFRLAQTLTPPTTEKPNQP
jgi:toxoflavin biosynthesis protein ToxD